MEDLFDSIRFPMYYWLNKDTGEVRPVLLREIEAWQYWKFGTLDTRIELTKIGKDCAVSTVFLGVDHSFGGPVPVLFETLVFGGPLDGECARYTTLKDAREGHRVMLHAVLERLEQLN